jgi:uracil-DNA glycosylase family 4
MTDSDVFVPYSGPENASIMVVGESPGKQEVIDGAPFVGPAGKLLRDCLRAAGINPAHVRFANLSHYRPPRDDLSLWLKDGHPENPLLMASLIDLAKEVRRVQPNVLITLGALPTAFCTSAELSWDKKLKTYTGIGEWRGSILNGSELIGLDQKCVAAYHPSYIFRGAYADQPWLVFDLERAREQSTFREIRRPDIELIIDPRGADREDVRRRLLETGDAITLDIEYSRRTNKMYCIGFTSGPDWAATIPVRNEADIQFTRDVLLAGRPLVAQNGMFDCSILEWHYKIPMFKHLAYDTMIAAHVLNIEFPKDLGFLCRQYTEQPNYWSRFDGAYWNALDKLPPGPERDAKISEQWTYNATDVWVTAAIRKAQLEELNTDSLRWANAHEMALVSALWEVSVRGCRIDIDRMQRLTAECDAAIEKGMEILSMFNHGARVNIKSGPQVRKLLLAYGVKLTKKSPKGGLKTDDTTLAEAALLLPESEDGNIARGAIKVIRDTRKSRDLKSKFCEIELDRDQRMRCMYDPAKTDTARLSSRTFTPTGTGSNLQNVPKDPRARSIFIADPGMEFGYADLERAESLVVAHISGDEELLRVHGPGIDAHLAVASIIFEIDYDELRAAYKAGDKRAFDQRYLGKQVGHSGNYMRGWKRLQTLVNANAQKTGIAIDARQAKRYTEAYRQSRPGLLRWWRDTEEQLRRTRTLSNLLGRRRVFYDRLNSILPNAIAYVPQSTVGDALNVGLLNCAGLPVQFGRSELLDSGYYQPDVASSLRELGFQILLQVHDAIGFQYPTENRHLVLPIVRQALAVPLTIPRTREQFTIPVEILIGPNWGETEPYTDDLRVAA